MAKSVNASSAGRMAIKFSGPSTTAEDLRGGGPANLTCLPLNPLYLAPAVQEPAVANGQSTVEVEF